MKWNPLLDILTVTCTVVVVGVVLLLGKLLMVFWGEWAIVVCILIALILPYLWDRLRGHPPLPSITLSVEFGFDTTGVEPTPWWRPFIRYQQYRDGEHWHRLFKSGAFGLQLYLSAAYYPPEVPPVYSP